MERPDEPIYQMRTAHVEQDWPMIEQWYYAHGKTPPPAAMMPKCGIVVMEFSGGEPLPVAAMWLYLDNSVGVSFLEHVVTAPGLDAKRARAALLHGMECLRVLAAGMDYGVMMCHTMPAIARTLRGKGWIGTGAAKVPMMLLTRQQEGDEYGNRS